MSIIRLSALKDVLYATGRRGALTMAPFRNRPKPPRGRIGQFGADGPEPGAAGRLADHLDHYLGDGAPADGQPIAVMVHGFLFDPKQGLSDTPADSDNPHSRVYHFIDGDEADEIRHHTSSWPLHLGFQEDDGGANGLAVAFGWQSQPGFASSLLTRFQNFYARAYDNAGLTARALVGVIDGLQTALPGRPIDIFCHSLGSRVVVRALAQMANPDRPELHALLDGIERVVILGGSEYVFEAQLMSNRIAARPDAAAPSFYNIVSRENDVLDILGENFGPGSFGNHQVIGHNGLEKAPGVPYWMDLQFDSGELGTWMQAYGDGFTIAGDNPGFVNIWDHWYYYTFRPNMAVYRAILRDRVNWTLPQLRTAGVKEGVSKRFGWDHD